jgi:hypothetical protein
LGGVTDAYPQEVEVGAPDPRAVRLSASAARMLLTVVLLLVAVQSSWLVGTARAADPVIAAAGDIACDPIDSHFNGGVGVGTAGTSGDNCRQASVATTIEGIPGLQAVLDLGDNQYYCGSLQAFLGSYDKSWGAFKAITHPSVGNHEYLTAPGSSPATACDPTNAGASGHYQYFGAAAGMPGQGYYSFDLGTWHLIALNSTCSGAGGCGATSPQGKWLAADLAANTRPCTLAYWHIPLFSSGGRASSNSLSFFAALYAAKADVILNGHDHIYERFAPQTSTGAVDALNGIREFIVGTGGANHTSLTGVAANSEVRDTTTFGALKMTLHAGSYDWQFLNSRGAFTDSGSATCHRSDAVAPSAPTHLTGTATSATSVSLSWTGSTDNVGVAGYRVFRDGSQIGTTTAASFTDTLAAPSTTATYSVAAFDGAGNQSTGNPTVTVTTPAAPAGGGPTKPGTPSAVSVTDTTATLTWTRSTDDVAVDHYTVTRNGTLLATSIPQPTFGDPQFTDTGLTANTTYQYVITAVDGDGNSAASSAGQITTAPPAGGVSLVRQATGTSASGTTLTVPITSTAGDALVAAIAVKAGGSVTVTTVTDSTGAAWTKGPVGFMSGSNSRIELWYRTGASAVSNVTATFSATIAAAASISEWHGIAASGALDAQAGIGTAATTTPQTPAATTTVAGDLVIGALNWPGAATSTLTSSGFTSLTDYNVTTSVNGRAAYLVPTTTGTYRATWNLTTAFPNGTAILALKPA